MQEAFSFRALCGKGSCMGYIRGEAGETQIYCQGLRPGSVYRLYCDGHPEHAHPAAPNGTLSLSCHRNGFFFLCHETDGLQLWEEGEDKTDGYFRALSLLPKKKKAAPEKANLPPEPSLELSLKSSAAMLPKEPEFPLPPKPLSEKAPVLPRDLLSENSAALPQNEPEEPLPPEPSFSLRKTSQTPMAYALPALFWPPSIRHLQPSFSQGTPYRPFALPGFRCVKLPSPSPALPYILMGYQTKNSQVSALLHAVPGHPLIPPRGFEGCTHQNGHFLRILQVKA